MDLTAFFGVVSTVDFALLGLWWVAVQTRRDLRDHRFGTNQMSYLVSLQFLVPGTASMLAQTAPGFDAVWRVSFTLASLTGAIAILSIAPRVAALGEHGVARLMRWGALPLYIVITVIALFPQVVAWKAAQMNALQIEAVLFCLMIFLGAQTAWVAAMQPEREPSTGPSTSASRETAK